MNKLNSRKIRFEELVFEIQKDPLYGIEADNLSTLLDRIEHRLHSNDAYKLFKDRFDVLPISAEQSRQLAFFVCCMFEMPTYQDGKETGWYKAEILNHWTEEFEISLKDLKTAFRKNKLPLPVAFFENEADNTQRNVELDEEEFDQEFERASLIIELEKEKAEFQETTANTVDELLKKKEYIKEIDNKIDQLKSMPIDEISNRTDSSNQYTRIYLPKLKRRNEWFNAIDEASLIFQSIHKKFPEGDEVWSMLIENPPPDYGIEIQKDKHETVLILNGRPMRKKGFLERWGRFTKQIKVPK